MSYNKLLRTIVLTILVSSSPCGLLFIIETEAAQEEIVEKKEKGKDIVKEDKTLTGKVGFINSEFISIIDQEAQDDGSYREKLLYLDDFVDVISKESLDEIKTGDTVHIQFEEKTRTLKDVRKSKKTVKSVKFLRAKETKKSSLKSGKK